MRSRHAAAAVCSPAATRTTASCSGCSGSATAHSKIADLVAVRAHNARRFLHAAAVVVLLEHDVAASRARDKPTAAERGKSTDTQIS
jgi:hypothetical protein